MAFTYQDCDDPELASHEPELNGIKAHVVIETSPGKRQRIWHTDAIPAFRQKAIHDHMAGRHYHDPSTHGAERLLRLPGFHNWSVNKDGSFKYPDGPVAHVISTNDAPRLTAQQVFDAFGFRNHRDDSDTIHRIANVGQSSGDLPDHKVYNLDRERAKSAPRNTGRELAHIGRQSKGITIDQLTASNLLDVMSRIDPDCHRNDWRRALGALHYMCDGQPWGKTVAERWSIIGEDKWNAKAFEKHWNGLNKDYPYPATLKTLVRLARTAQPDERSIKVREELSDIECILDETLTYRTPDVEWPDLVAMDDGYRPRERSRLNVEHLLRVTGMPVAYDMFQQEEVIGPDLERVSQQHINDLMDFAQQHGFMVRKTELGEQITYIASGYKFDPVKEYFDSLPEWDGTPRIATMFIRHVGTPDSPSIRETAVLIMVASVRRTHQPGYKFDLMPILEGKQEIGKSSLFRILVPSQDWFSESPSLNEEAKRLIPQFTGKLFVEFPEMAGKNRADLDKVKKLVTTQEDEYIENYGTKKTRVKRRAILIGTINEGEYLRDLTGNRRHPIIQVTKELDYDALKAERDQLWAEAITLEKSFPEQLRLSPEAKADMERIQQERLDVDPMTSDVLDELRQIESGWLTSETLWERMGLPYGERQKRFGHPKHVFREIRQCMKGAGWDLRVSERTEDGKVATVMRKGEAGCPAINCNGGTLAIDTRTEADKEEAERDRQRQQREEQVKGIELSLRNAHSHLKGAKENRDKPGLQESARQFLSAAGKDLEQARAKLVRSTALDDIDREGFNSELLKLERAYALMQGEGDPVGM